MRTVTFQKLAWLNWVVGSNFIWPYHITANKWDYLNPITFNSKGTLVYRHNAYLAFRAKEIRQLLIKALLQVSVQIRVHQTHQLGQ
jgi:hypothetical protein